MGITPINTNYAHQEIPKIETQITTFESGQDSEDVISFIESPSECCVGIVDIVGSTKATAKLPYSQVGKYYGTFLNTMTVIVKRFGGIVVKNGGDSLLYYFQGASSDDKSVYVKCLECSLAMVEAHSAINSKLHQEKLPSLDFRVSADYGKVTLATSSNSTYHDIFGSPVNFCSKINAKAAPNTVAIGGDLHQMAKELKCYSFQEIKSYSVGFKFQYPIFAVSRNDAQCLNVIEVAIEKTLLDMGKPVLDTVSCKIFQQHGCLLSDCCRHPELLTTILADLFGNSHTDIITTLKKNLNDQALQQPVQRFLSGL
jgi:class 3 adenylate cyclase